jgi:hypothetical protein
MLFSPLHEQVDFLSCFFLCEPVAFLQLVDKVPTPLFRDPLRAHLDDFPFFSAQQEHAALSVPPSLITVPDSNLFRDPTWKADREHQYAPEHLGSTSKTSEQA